MKPGWLEQAASDRSGSILTKCGFSVLEAAWLSLSPWHSTSR